MCYNMDRHTENFGLLRDVETGNVISLGPNYDNNIALISKGYPSDVTRKNDGLIRFFSDFVTNCKQAAEMYKRMDLPVITAPVIEACMDDIPVEVNRDFVRDFILNGQEKIREIVNG